MDRELREILDLRKKEETKKKADYAIFQLGEIGVDVLQKGYPHSLHFYHKCRLCIYYPLKEWLTGPTVKDGRGLKHLLKQLNTYS